MDSAVDDVTGSAMVERVRTILARGAGGSMETGLLRRPVRSVRVRDDGAIALVIDASDAPRGVGVAAVGATATVEVVDTVCTGRCRTRSPRPSFAVDGRPSPRGDFCDDDDNASDCAVSRGIVTISGIITATTGARRRRLVAADVAADGAGVDSGGDDPSLRLSELQPLEITHVRADGVSMISRAELAAAAVDPIGADEQAWLRRLASDAELAARLALRAGRQIAGTDPWIVGLDRHGVDLAVNAGGAPSPTRSAIAGSREVVRLPFAQVCRDSDDVLRELAALS